MLYEFYRTSSTTSPIYINSFLPQPETQLLSNQTFGYRWSTEKINEMQILLATAEHVIQLLKLLLLITYACTFDHEDLMCLICESA